MAGARGKRSRAPVADRLRSAVRHALLDVLAEPRTRAALRLGASGSGEAIEDGWLVSGETGRRYPIVRGIPRFVEGQAYAGSFGLQWRRFREVQLDSVTGRRYSQRRFDAELGLTEADLRGKWVLDAGCGAGRFAEVAAARGARLVALDVSEAVDAARSTLAPFGTADVVQGSVLEPPFRAGGERQCSFQFRASRRRPLPTILPSR